MNIAKISFVYRSARYLFHSCHLYNKVYTVNSLNYNLLVYKNAIFPAITAANNLKKPVNKAVNQTDNDILIFSLRHYVPPVV